MEIPTEPLKLAVFLYLHLEQREVDGRNVSGVLPEPLDYDAAQNILDEHGLSGIGDPQCRQLEFRLPFRPDCFFAFSLEDLLENPKRRHSGPSRFYLADIDTFYDPAQPVELPVVVESYLAARDLIDALKSIADHVYSTPNDSLRLVFLGSKKLEIEVDYSPDDLCPLPGLTEFKADFVESDIHVDQKATILRSAMLELFSHDDQSLGCVPLAKLLRRFPAFCSEVRNSYGLYVAEFSFEKVKGQIEKEKVEFITRLNKIFSDIQNQLLAVPAALILVGSQMKNTGGLAESNMLIWFGCIVFAIFMTLLIRNQRITLQAVRKEIQHQWHQIENEHRTVADRFSDVYSLLDRRYKQQKWLLRAVDLLVATVVALTTGLLLWYSTTLAKVFGFLSISMYVGIPLLLLYIYLEFYREPRLQA